jgi:hypothetical protein
MMTYYPKLGYHQLEARQAVFERILSELPIEEKIKATRIINHISKYGNKNGVKVKGLGKKGALELIGCLGIWAKIVKVVAYFHNDREYTNDHIAEKLDGLIEGYFFGRTIAVTCEEVEEVDLIDPNESMRATLDTMRQG